MSVVTDRYENIWRAEERAAATAKLKRATDRAHRDTLEWLAIHEDDEDPPGPEEAANYALDAVVRAWEEEP
jgi:hypothetical protein